MTLIQNKWKTNNPRILNHKENSIPTIEQEISFNSLRDENIFEVSCSDLTYITKLRKNPSFLATEITYNAYKKIVCVRGLMPKKNISLRSKVYSELFGERK